jgi:hypothetical protein
VRALALLFATMQLLATGIAAFVMWFVATFPWENQPPDAGEARMFLMGAAATIFVLAMAIVVAVALNRPLWATTAFAFHAIAAVVILAWALEGSDHSDGKLVGFTLSIELCALAAVVVCAKDAGVVDSC